LHIPSVASSGPRMVHTPSPVFPAETPDSWNSAVAGAPIVLSHNRTSSSPAWEEQHLQQPQQPRVVHHEVKQLSSIVEPSAASPGGKPSHPNQRTSSVALARAASVELTDARSFDEQTSDTGDEEDEAQAFAKVKFYVEKLQDGRSSTRLKIAVALSILVMLGVGTAVFVVGKDMSKEAVKSLELITFAGNTRLTTQQTVFFVRSMDIAANEPNRSYLMNARHDAARTSLGLTPFEYFRQNAYNLTSRTVSMSETLLAGTLDNEELMNFWRTPFVKTLRWDATTGQYSTAVRSLWDVYQDFSGNMLYLTALRESDFTQGGDNMEAFRWVVDNTPARMFNAIWELTYKYEESFSERLRSQIWILWGLVAISILVPVLLFVLLFAPAARKIKSARNSAMDLFLSIPKSTISRIQNKLNNVVKMLGRRQEAAARMEASLQETSKRKTSLTKLLYVVVALMTCGVLLLLVGLVLTILVFEDFQKRGAQINYSAGRRALSVQGFSNLQESIEGSREQNNQTVRNTVNFLQDVHRGLKFGDSMLGLTPSVGKDSAQDQVTMATRCASIQQPACQSLDEQLNSYLTDIENLLEIGTALNYTNKVYQGLMERVEGKDQIAELLDLSRLYYFDFAVSTVNINSSTLDLLFGLLVSSLVLGFFLLVQPMLTQVHKEVLVMQKMLLLIPLRVVNETPAIRDFLVRGNTGKVSKKGGQQDDRSASHLAAAVDPVVEISEEGSLLMMNSFCLDLFQIPNEESMLGKSLSALLNNGDSVLQSMLSNLRNTGDFNDCQDLEGRKQDGTVFPLRLSVAKGWKNDRRIFVAYMSDITGEHLQNDLMEQQELLESEKARSEELLLNVLPGPIAARLKEEKGTIADGVNVTAIFIDMVGFTSMSSGMQPADLVKLLDDVFVMMDRVAEKHNVDKIKTIGDCFMAVGGLFDRCPNHAQAVVEFALEVLESIQQMAADLGRNVRLRAGISTGKAIAGVIGKIKFAYDIWGPAIEAAAAMESNGVPDRVRISRTTYERVYRLYDFEDEREIKVKDGVSMLGYVVKGRKGVQFEASPASPGGAPTR